MFVWVSEIANAIKTCLFYAKTDEVEGTLSDTSFTISKFKAAISLQTTKHI